VRALVVYESMYGNTRAIGEAIARGMRSAADVQVVPAEQATAEAVASADLLVVGGPTHLHGMSRAKTRATAHDRAALPNSGLTLDPDAGGVGLDEWLATLPRVKGKPAAAFDTRVTGRAWITGRASKAIGGRLRRRGFRLVTDPESFLVERPAQLVAGETDRAERWGIELLEKLP
jgi:hypothetical protein